MQRAAIYARYSSDQQSETSIEDQVRACRRHAERFNLQVVDVYTDQAISGVSIARRPGFQQLLEDARSGRFDVVVAEALDRLTRSGGDAWDIFEGLASSGVRIHTISEGEVEEMAIGLKGTMNALFLRELARKTRRGQEGVARSGRAAGGRCYGYDVHRELDARGEIVRGLRTINEAEADVVRRIFREYVAGLSPRSIAGRLNEEGIAAPRGGQWNASTINGNAERGNGVIHNELYRGVLVWGRQTFVKDRRTGSRRGRLVSADDSVRTEVPELRIVDDELWNAARDRYASLQRKVASEGVAATRRPKRLLQGLVRCGVCGGPMTIAGPDARYICTWRRERGPSVCEGGRTAKSDVVERMAIQAIGEQVLPAAALEAALKDYFAEQRRTAKARHRTRQRLETEIATCRRKTRRVLELVELGELDDKAEINNRLRELKQQRNDFETQLAEVEDHDVQPHPAAAARYRELVGRLEEALGQPDTPDSAEAREAVRDLIKAVVIVPVEGRGCYRIEIRTDLAPVLRIKNAKGPLAGASGEDTPMVGAGTGFEPVTFRL